MVTINQKYIIDYKPNRNKLKHNTNENHQTRKGITKKEDIKNYKYNWKRGK